MPALFSTMHLDDVLANIQSSESEYINRLCIEFKASSNVASDQAVLLADDNTWMKSSYTNEELNSDRFLKISDLKEHQNNKKNEKKEP